MPAPWTDAYLARIGYDGPRDPSPELLRELHVRHLMTVPFENLDIHWKRPIVVETGRFLDKIVRERRGGFCYELNGAFAALLRELGFDVKLLSGRVISAGGNYGPPFDHMALLVDGEWIADVGFGESSLYPLRLDGTPEDGYRVLDGQYQALREGKWETDYYFDLEPHQLHEFGPMCDHQQYSPDSPFTKKKICSLATPDGRITLTADKLIVTKSGVREETPVGDWEQALYDTFGIRPAAAPA
jgi:N-hydroxyarylamine O-acetyltransferase